MPIALNHSFKTSLIVLATATLFSCNHHHDKTIKGSGNFVKEKRELNESFKGIEVSNAIEVIIEQANKTEVLVEADDNIQKSIRTEIKNGILYISRNNENCGSSEKQKVTVRLPFIEELTANSASVIKTENTLKGEHIRINASSAAKINLKLAVDNIEVKTSSASKIEIEGMTLFLNAESSSASKIEAEDLLANEIIAQSSSGSKIKIHPIVSLKADANSGGNIEFEGNPKQIEKTISSGGSINQE